MAGEEGLAMVFEVSFIGVHQTIEPRQKLLGAMIRVEYHRDIIGRSN